MNYFTFFRKLLSNSGDKKDGLDHKGDEEDEKNCRGVIINNIYVTINVEACQCGKSEQTLSVVKTKTEVDKLVNIVENINYKDGDFYQ